MIKNIRMNKVFHPLKHYDIGSLVSDLSLALGLPKYRYCSTYMYRNYHTYAFFVLSHSQTPGSWMHQLPSTDARVGTGARGRTSCTRSGTSAHYIHVTLVVDTGT